jgi:hypothetical protein
MLKLIKTKNNYFHTISKNPKRVNREASRIVAIETEMGYTLGVFCGLLSLVTI